MKPLIAFGLILIVLTCMGLCALGVFTRAPVKAPRPVHIASLAELSQAVLHGEPLDLHITRLTVVDQQTVEGLVCLRVRVPFADCENVPHSAKGELEAWATACDGQVVVPIEMFQVDALNNDGVIHGEVSLTDDSLTLADHLRLWSPK